MPNTKGRSKIIIQPDDTKVGITVRIKPASTAIANDGYIEYGTTVSGVVSIIYDEDNNDVTSDIKYANPTVSDGEYIRIELKYPEIAGDGRYTLKHLLTLSNGGTKTWLYSRIYAKDLR